MHDDDEDMDFLYNCPSRYIVENDLPSLFNNHSSVSAIDIMHINARSLNKNIDKINLLLECIPCKLTAIAITESWLNDSNAEAIFIPGYNFFYKCRIGKSGGGVGIFVNNDFNCQLRTDLCCMSSDIECVFVEISITLSNTVIVGSIYRPPGTLHESIDNFNNELYRILNLLEKDRCKTVAIAGDYNLDILKCKNHRQTADF